MPGPSASRARSSPPRSTTGMAAHRMIGIRGMADLLYVRRVNAIGRRNVPPARAYSAVFQRVSTVGWSESGGGAVGRGPHQRSEDRSSEPAGRRRSPSPRPRLAAGLLILLGRANALPGVVGLWLRRDLLDCRLVSLLVLRALRIGRGARLVAERKAERGAAARGAKRLAIRRTRQQHDDRCRQYGSHAQVPLTSRERPQNLTSANPASVPSRRRQFWHRRPVPANPLRQLAQARPRGQGRAPVPPPPAEARSSSEKVHIESRRAPK